MLELAPRKYTTKANDLGREFDSCAKHVRTGTNFEYENTKAVTNYRKRVDSANFRSTTSEASLNYNRPFTRFTNTPMTSSNKLSALHSTNQPEASYTYKKRYT